MSRPDFYDPPGERVELRETHISWVFLVGERAFKLRKPVTFPFLDYGSRERRRHMCEEELRLGRRLAPELYVGLRTVVPRANGFALADANAEAACETVVEMRRFDEADTLAARLERGEVEEQDVRALGRLIAEFHGGGAAAPPGSFGPSQVAATVTENFTTLLAFADEIGDPRLAAAHRFAVAFLHGHHDELAARERGGHVRECHGDLRAEHVIFEDGRVEIFDPVEFDPALRLIDPSADLAFLVMELIEAGRGELSTALIEEYRGAGGDDGGAVLLAFYACYRAWVRAKVACLRATELPRGETRRRELSHARSLAERGERLSWRVRAPTVLVICGGAATGKTYLANALAAASGLPRLSSDLLRKELAGVAPEQRAPLEQYSEHTSRATYRELGARAAAAAPGGVVVDATFRRRAHRDAFQAGYGDAAPAPVFVECRAPADVTAEWARRRERDPHRVSDATADIAARQRAEFEDLDEIPPDQHVTVRTDRPIADTVDELEAALDARLARRG